MAQAKSGGASAAGGSFATVALCYLIALFEGFDLQAAGVAAPRLGPAFKMAPNDMGWFFSSSTFGLMLGAAIGGRLSDRFGRRTVLIFSVAVFGAMSVLTAFAPNIEGLIVARFLTGVGLGGALPNLVALVSENTAPERKNASIGLLYAGMPSGGALVSLVSLVGAPEDWRIVFLVGGLAPLVAIPLLLWVLPDSRQFKAAQAAHTLDTHGFVNALFRHGRAARTLALWCSFFLALLSMYLLLNWLPTLMVSRGLTRPEASLTQMSFNVLGAMASFVTGWLLDRQPRSRMVLGSFISTALALGLLVAAPAHFAISLVVVGLVGITISSTQSLLYAFAPANYPTQVRGTGVGSAVAVGRLGSAAGPLLAGALLTAGRSPESVLLMLVPVILVSGAAAFFLHLRMGATERAAA